MGHRCLGGVGEMNLVHHFQVFRRIGIAQKCVRIVCSRLMYNDMTPAFILQ